MKRISKHIISLILIGYFLIAGLGFNIINYCCDGCEEHGIVEVALNSCGNIHHAESNCCQNTEHLQTEDQAKDITCDKISHHPDSCHLLRIQVETPTNTSKFILKDYQIYIELAFQSIFTSYVNIHSTEDTNEITYSPPNTTNTSGRKILSNKSVLII